MKTITPYLVKFAITASILTIIFRFFLSYGINEHSKTIILSSAVIYGLMMFVSGWFFGKKDGEYLPIFDVGFRFHLTTYVIHNGISLLWIGLGFGSAKENIDVVLMTMLYWGIFLVLHFVFYLWASKNAIEHLDKNDIFD